MLQNSINDRLQGEDGATAVEYGLLVGLIGIAIIGVVGLLGEDLIALFDEAGDTLGGVTAETPTV